MARFAQMIDGGVGRDPVGPRPEIAFGIEPGARAVNAPERFHGKVLGDSGVTNDAHDPRVNLLLVLAKQHLEGVQVAGRETLQEFHSPLSTCITGYPATWLQMATRYFKKKRPD